VEHQDAGSPCVVAASAVRGAFVLLIALASAATSPTAAGDRRGREWLAEVFDLTAQDLADIDKGQIISRALEPSDDREVALLGVVRVAIPPDEYAARLRDVARFRTGSPVLAVGTFQDPATTADVGGLVLPPDDVEEWRHCTAEDCDLRLTRDVLARLDGNGGGMDPTAMMRRMLVGIVHAYRTGGTLPVYATDDGPVSVAAEFRSVVVSEHRVLPRFAALRSHLLGRPAPQADITDLIYWSKDTIGPSQVVSVTHLAVARTAHTSPAAYVAASKQLYADHYFDASLGLTVLVDDSGGGRRGTIVAYLNRSRVDVFDGWLGSITRVVVRARARSALASYLAELQQRLGPQRS
jgi:hypothetical protein